RSSTSASPRSELVELEDHAIAVEGDVPHALGVLERARERAEELEPSRVDREDPEAGAGSLEAERDAGGREEGDGSSLHRPGGSRSRPGAIARLVLDPETREAARGGLQSRSTCARDRGGRLRGEPPKVKSGAARRHLLQDGTCAPPRQARRASRQS